MKQEDIEKTGGLYEVFDVMRNHVDDATANQALQHLEEKHGIRFKVYVFTANDLTGAPKYLLEQGMQGKCNSLVELCLSRNNIEKVDLKTLLECFPSLEVLNLSQNYITTVLESK